MSKQSTKEKDMDAQLALATLTADLALTNRQLVAAGLPPLTVSPVLTSVGVVLAHLRTVAGLAGAGRQTSAGLRKQLAAQRAQMAALAKDADAHARTLRDLRDASRQLAVADAQLAAARKRAKDLEAEIAQVRRDFGAGGGGGGGAARKQSSVSLRSQARPSRTATPALSHSPAPLSPAQAQASPATVKTVDKELEGADLARRAAEIARRHAASFSYDSSSMQTAQFAVGRATQMAESALATYSVVAPSVNTSGSSPSSLVTAAHQSPISTHAGSAGLGEKHTTSSFAPSESTDTLVEESFVTDAGVLVEEYARSSLTKETSSTKAGKKNNRRSRRLAKPVALSDSDAAKLSAIVVVNETETEKEE
ncbi:hypothetical protein BDR26DRAFT_860534 [Obelidium mucronatum]|nr:hypothetical protein BDR26DRAFT_860534 [Obelidium mucronatum]